MVSFLSIALLFAGFLLGNALAISLLSHKHEQLKIILVSFFVATLASILYIPIYTQIGLQFSQQTPFQYFMPLITERALMIWVGIQLNGLINKKPRGKKNGCE